MLSSVLFVLIHRSSIQRMIPMEHCVLTQTRIRSVPLHCMVKIALLRSNLKSYSILRPAYQIALIVLTLAIVLVILLLLLPLLLTILLIIAPRLIIAPGGISYSGQSGRETAQSKEIPTVQPIKQRRASQKRFIMECVSNKRSQQAQKGHLEPKVPCNCNFCSISYSMQLHVTRLSPWFLIPWFLIKSWTWNPYDL